MRNVVNGFNAVVWFVLTGSALSGDGRPAWVGVFCTAMLAVNAVRFWHDIEPGEDA